MIIQSPPAQRTAFPRRLVMNGGSIFAGEASARAATFLVAVVIARMFGPVALGQYGYAVAITSVLLLLPDAGLHLFIVRELAASPDHLRSVFWEVHWLKLPIVALVVAFSLLFGEIAVNGDGRRFLLYVLLAKVVLQTFSQATMAVFKAFERMQYIAVQQFANAFLAAAFLGTALLLHGSLTWVVLALVAGQALETLTGWCLIRKSFSPGPLCTPDRERLRKIFFAGAPIGIAALLQALNLRLDVLTLSPFAANSVLGGYQAAGWFPLGAFLLVSLVMTTLFPKMARLLQAPGKQGNDYVQSLLKTGVLFMTVVAVLAGLLAPYLLRVIFGANWGLAASLLRVLVIALPLIFVNTALFYVCVAAQKRNAYLTALSIGAAVGGGLSLMLSAKFGPGGTATAFVLREICISSVYLVILNFGELAKWTPNVFPMLAYCCGGLIVLVFLLGDSSVIGIVWSIALLGGITIFLRGYRLQEMRLLLNDSL